MAANLHGVWAKWERAIEQLTALDKEVTAFCSQPHPYTIRSHDHRKDGCYRFEIYPAWQPGIPYRWGAIFGEIVHDLRSALDNLVWQLVVLNGGNPDNRHSFPICAKEPSKGFAVETRREWTDKRGRKQHAPLFGLSDDAVAIVAACQPYAREDGLLLKRLHDLWNLDKHRHLVPMQVIAPPPRLTPERAAILSRDDRLEGGAYVVEVTVPPDTYVDVEPQPPTDVTLGDGAPIVLELKRVGQLIMMSLLIPAGDLFPEMLGVGLPHPT